MPPPGRGSGALDTREAACIFPAADSLSVHTPLPHSFVERPLDLLRFVFTFEERVDQRRYIITGVSLMAFKYAVDALVIWLTLGRVWTPLEYLRLGFSPDGLIEGPASTVFLALAAWSIPFLWIAVTMSMRRAIDAGKSPWLLLLLLVPYVNYGAMVALAALPSRARPEPSVRLEVPPQERAGPLSSALVAMGIGSVLGFAALAYLIFVAKNYGVAMFFDAPFTVGAVTAYLYNRRYPATLKMTCQVIVLTFAFMGGVVIMVAVEGAVCVLMAAPLVLTVACLGAIPGRSIALRREGSGIQPFMAMLLIPAAALTERAQPASQLHEILSVIEIDAPTDVVWRHVIQFSELEPPTETIFRFGIAYPIRARIEGSGVGAVRHCEFSTGAFVEPITRWEPGRLLAFDVTKQPPPLEEWSPYADIAPPHLDGYIQSRRGEFRLIALDGGRTRLEGRTWYTLDIRPRAYWMMFSDAFIGRVHRRVLTHIERLAEAESSPLPRDAR